MEISYRVSWRQLDVQIAALAEIGHDGDAKSDDVSEEGGATKVYLLSCAMPYSGFESLAQPNFFPQSVIFPTRWVLKFRIKFSRTKKKRMTGDAACFPNAALLAAYITFA